MADGTKIEWAHATFNPWLGCEKVSPACDHCYAEGWARRTGQAHLWSGERRRTTEAYWRGPLAWNAAVGPDGKRVFCASLADVFDAAVPEAWRDDLWSLIARTPKLTWMLLTKRPENIRHMLPEGWNDWPRPNVWLGTTIENQDEMAKRVGHLLYVRARVHFLSCEPLLGRLSLPAADTYWHPVEWVICGGESGGGAREMDADWARSLRDQCRAAGVPFFMKQMTKKARIPDDLMVREFPQ